MHCYLPHSLSRRPALLLSLVLIVVTVSNLPAQEFRWEPFNTGMYGGDISSIAFNANGNPVVGTGAGIVKGEPDHESGTYRFRLTGPQVLSPDIEAAPGGTLWARTWQGIFRSEDDGESWSLAIEHRAALFAVVDDSTVVWCDWGQFSTYITRDGGATRTEITSDPGKLSDYVELIEKIVSTPDRTLYLIGRNGSDLAVSKDLGGHWQGRKGAGSPFPTSTLPLPLGDGLLVQSVDGGVARSTDDGISWETVAAPHMPRLASAGNGDLYGFGLRPAEERMLYGTHPLYRSTDLGLTWNEIGDYRSYPTPPPSEDNFTVGPDGRFWDGAWNGLVTSSDEGTTWVENSTGIEACRIHSFFYESGSDELYAAVDRWDSPTFPGAVQPFRDRLYKLAPNRSEWIPLADSLGKAIGVDAAGNLYAVRDTIGTGVDLSAPAAMEASTDGGGTWKRLAETSTRDWSVSGGGAGTAVVQERTSFYQLKPVLGEILLTTDGGTTWKSRADWLPGGIEFISLCHVLGDGTILLAEFTKTSEGDRSDDRFWKVDPTDNAFTLLDTLEVIGIVEGPGSTLYAYGRGTIARSVNNGTWDRLPLPEGADRTRILGLNVGRDETLYLHFQPAVNQDSIYYSSDFGRTWEPVTVDNPEIGLTTSYYRQLPLLAGDGGWVMDTMLYEYGERYEGGDFLEEGTGLYFSRDYGDAWRPVRDGMEGTDVTAIIMTPDRRVYVGTREHGVYRLQGTLSAPGDAPSVIGMNATVSPMPATGHTEVAFDMEGPGDVRVELFDMRGERVLMTERSDIPSGRRNVSLELEGLAAGTYILRIVAGDHAEALSVIVR